MFQQATKDENSETQQSYDQVVLPKEAQVDPSDGKALILPPGPKKLDKSTQEDVNTESEVKASKDWQNAPQPPTAGKVFLVGGGYPVPENIRKSFLQTVSEASESNDFKDLKLVIIPSASGDFFGKNGSDEERQERKRPWTELGVTTISILNALSPNESKGLDFSNPIDSADAVWITGGDQQRLSYLYCGTPVEKALIKLLNRGGVIGGSSSGAAIMCNPMICGGDTTPIMGRGFPFVNAVIDQHFSQRNRESRLILAISQTKDDTHRVTGIGIDDNSAVIWDVKSASVKAVPGSIAYYYKDALKHQVKETDVILSPEPPSE